LSFSKAKKEGAVEATPSVFCGYSYNLLL
jgi:hypothetical protein